MNRQEVKENLIRVDRLAAEVNENAPPDDTRVLEFRADLAGLLVVLVCATYENCVKQTIFAYAEKQSPYFGVYAQSQYERINSKIDVPSLKKLTKTFHPDLGNQFDRKLKLLKSAILKSHNADITAHYDQILKWRHSFAHAGTRSTTIEEVLKHHHYAKRIIYLFSDCFMQFPQAART